MVFANIEYLFLLLLLIPYIVWYILKQKKSEATLQISDARVYAHTPKSYKNYLLHVPFLLRCLALVLVILVLARPNKTMSVYYDEFDIPDHDCIFLNIASVLPAVLQAHNLPWSKAGDSS